ncbi:MAG: hypothetical protein IJ529_05330 [Alphaproteobacteria bacterium]|nr:hypothetical protein [Alphaproteobacteria bacterium]MBQ8677870.1 hypothetical protein [Alphaproteobacteria bacterium]
MANYTKKITREICVQLRLIREQKGISIYQVMSDLEIKKESLEQMELYFSASLKNCYKLMDYYGYCLKLVPKE